MKFYLFITYCAACVANAALVPQANPESLDHLRALPDFNKKSSLLGSTRSGSRAQQQEPIYQGRRLLKRGAARTDSPKGKSSDEDDSKHISGSSSSPKRKQNRSMRITQNKSMIPPIDQGLIVGSRSRGAARLPLDTQHESSPIVVTGDSKKDEKPDGPDSKPPLDYVGMRRSKTPPARASITVNGSAIAYIGNPSRGTRYFEGGRETPIRKETTHSRQATAGGIMFRSNLFEIPPSETTTVSARGKNVRAQITPHVGGWGQYETSRGTQGMSIGIPPGVPMVIEASNLQEGQTAAVRAQLRGPGTIDVKASNQLPSPRRNG